MSVQSDQLPATSFVWQPRAGNFVLTAVAKATFVLEQGEARLAPEQEPVSESDAHWDDNPVRSLFIPSDLVPMKPRVDVVAVGHAFAAQGKRVRSLVARLSLGSVDKSIELFADRALGPDGSVFESGSFTRMPLVYERTRGGPGTWNPVGIGREDRDRHGNVRLPNLQSVGAPPNARLEPIGFGPIAPTWPPRADRVRYAGTFVTSEWTKRALPDGFELGFFNVAPADQQLDALAPDATLTLEHLHPEHARLVTRFPKIDPRATFEGRGAPQEQAMHVDTVWIDTDRGLCTFTYRAQLPLERADDRPGIRIQTSARGAPVAPRKRGNTPTGTFSTDPHSAGLPFGRNSPRGESTQTNMPALQDAAPEWMDRSPSPRQTIADQGPNWVAPAATPFAPTFGGAQPALRGQAKTMQAPHAGPPSPPSVPGAAMNPIAQAPMAAVAPAIPGAPLPAMQPVAAPLAAMPNVVAPPAVPLAPAMPAPPARADSPWAAAARSAVQPAHAQSAALLGVTGASNAAADVQAQGVGGAAVRKGRVTAIDLLWFDPDLLPRVRRKRPWKELIDELEKKPFDPELDNPSPGEDAADVEDRREIMQVITRGTPSGESGIDAALDDAVRADGRFAAPLLLVAGELALDFDELETLRAVVSIATPFASGDEDLKSAIERATAYLNVPGLVPSAEAARSLTTNVREAFAKGKRPVPGTYLDNETERALLEKRAYQKREVLGGKLLRGLLFFPGSTSGVPTYLPESLAKKLPLFRRIAVRILAEVVFQADQFESHPTALFSGAVARVVRGTT